MRRSGWNQALLIVLDEVDITGLKWTDQNSVVYFHGSYIGYHI